MNTENSANSIIASKLSTAVFYLSVLFFIIGFNFTDTPPGSFWVQQFMPNLNGASISDITFLDSLTGFAVTGYRSGNDSAYILKTSNSGNNWSVNTTYNYPFYRIQFINQDTGYALSFQKLFKTTNKGISWQIINIGISTAFLDMFALSIDTIWLVASESLTGGVYFSSNGGASWTQQYSMLNQNPSKIYMFNSRIGFASSTAGLLKTTNSGASWFVASNSFQFQDMHFTDSLTGWKCFGQTDSIQHTTDGGFNWTKQQLPPETFPLFFSRMLRFTFVNKDTIYGVGGTFNSGGGNKGIVYKTTNGGNNWGYQLPDTNTINIGRYSLTDFFNKLNGWAYSGNQGIHTTNGGDTTLLSTHQISAEVPKDFKLFQNYPNPFNPDTKIKYQITASPFPSEGGAQEVNLTVYDIMGRKITTLVNQKQTAGTYEVDFSGEGLSSGVYFYKLIVNDSKEVKEQTKKMMLIK